MATATMTTLPPLAFFTRESEIQKVRLAEDAWNTRDPGESNSGIRDRFTMEESLGVHQRTKRNHGFSFSQVQKKVSVSTP